MDLRGFAATSQLIRVLLTNSTTGAPLTGLTEASSGLIIGTIADVEATTTRYRASSSEIETISTLGTYAAPSANKCRFKEVDAVNHPGLYEIQLADARFAVTNATRLVVSWSGAASLLAGNYEIRLVQFNPQDSVRLGLTALPNAAAEASGGLYTRGSGAGQINQQANGQIDTNVERVRNSAINVLISGRVDASVGAYQTGLTPLQPTVAGRTLDVTATGAAGIDWGNVENQTTTVGLTGTTISSSQVVASVTGAVGSVTGAVGSVTGNVGGNVVGSVGSIATGGITAASFAAGAIDAAAIATDAIGAAEFSQAAADKVWATTTRQLTGTQTFNLTGNITGSLSGSVGSVTGNVGGNVTGSVGSVVGNVGGNVLGGVVGDLGGNVLGGVAGNLGGSVLGNVVGSVGSVTAAVTITGASVDAIWDEVVDGTTTARESWRLANSANGAITAGAATTTFTIRDLADTKDRVTATVDAVGNRSAVTRDLT